jgi:type II secretory ATPase GspE/PulE/Tfp pilus assembly ATPase PilB-like protein
VFERLLAMCGDHAAVAAAVALVLNQRLIRRLCNQCAGKGCNACLETGYKGRLPLVEWLRVNDALRRRITLRDVEGLKAAPSLAESGKRFVQEKLTNTAELERLFGADFA